MNKTTDLSSASSLKGRTILMVNTGSIKKRFIIQRLKKMGLKVVVLNKEKNWAQPYADHWILADNTNHSEALQAVQQFMTSHPRVRIEGAVTFWEDDVLLTSKIIDRFNFIGIPYAISRKARNKYLFRQFCHEHGIPAPRFHIIKNREDLESVAKTFAFPLVIKPAFGSSSAYVIKVKNREELFESYQFVTSAISTNTESALNDGLDIYVEEYLDGDEVDIDMLIQNGKVKFTSISDNYNKDKGTFFQDSGQAIPSSLPTKVQEELADVAEATCEKLGIQNGCIHFEGKYTKKGAFPIEVNLRMGGDYVYSYTKDALGVDLIEYAVKIALGEYIHKIIISAPKKYIIGWDLHSEDSGVLAELDIDEALEKKPFLEEIQIYKEVGDSLLVPPEGVEHLGWLTVSGENILDAQDNLKEALDLFSYKTVKFEYASSLGKTDRKDRFSSAVLNKNLLLRMAKLEAIKKTTLKNIRQLPIGLLCNLNAGRGRSGADLNDTPLEIERVLQKMGYDLTLINANDLTSVMDQIKRSNVDLVFNIGIGEKAPHAPKYKPHIASLLELMQIPYTGSNPFTMSLAMDKIRFKKILAYHEIPTPAWDYLYSLDEALDPELEFPLIVKPATAVHSVGVTYDSVVTNPEELHRELTRIIKEMGLPALVEEYVEGDEYEAFILGTEESNLQVLPLRRSLFNGMPQNRWHVHTSDVKGTAAEKAQGIEHQLPPKNINKKLSSLITEIALDVYGIFDCRDYGKVKFKLDEDDNPYVIEFNPNPSLHRELGLAQAAKMVGLDYPDLLEEILYMAVERYKRQSFFNQK